MDRLSRIVEPPPAIYASGPTQTGKTTEVTFDSPATLQAYCNLFAPNGHAIAHTALDTYAQACYIPSLDQVVLPSRKAWPSQAEIDAMRAHEWAHARGWRHGPGGFGTSPDSLPPANPFAKSEP